MASMTKFMGPQKSGQAHPQSIEIALTGNIADGAPIAATDSSRTDSCRNASDQSGILDFETLSERVEKLLAIRERIDGQNSATQRARLLDALRNLGCVSTFEAMRYLDIFDPRPRKLELIREGYKIQTIRRIVLTESGRRHCIGVYSLMDELSDST